jgi:hypothetical protein
MDFNVVIFIEFRGGRHRIHGAAHELLVLGLFVVGVVEEWGFWFGWLNGGFAGGGGLDFAAAASSDHCA